MLLLFFFFSHLHLKSEQLKFIIFPLNWIEKKKKKKNDLPKNRTKRKEREKQTEKKLLYARAVVFECIANG